jgi:hypothetical protein
MTWRPWGLVMLAWILWGQYAYKGVPLEEPFKLQETFQTFEACEKAFQFAKRTDQEIQEALPSRLITVQYICLPEGVPPTFTWPKGS